MPKAKSFYVFGILCIKKGINITKEPVEYNNKDKNTLKKFDVAGPRYTSYPTAPVWMDEGVPAILKGETLGLELTNKRVISQEEGAPGA